MQPVVENILDSVLGNALENFLESKFYKDEDFSIPYQKEKELLRAFFNIVPDEYRQSIELNVTSDNNCYGIWRSDYKGEIVLGSAVLNRLTEEKEYAFVIGHELGHMLLHHQERNANIIALSSLANRYFLHNGEVDKMLLSLTMRQDEYEADAVSMFLLNESGYKLRLEECPVLFGKMAGQRVLAKDGLLVFDSHPPIASRIAALSRYTHLSLDRIQAVGCENLRIAAFNGSSSEAKEIELKLKNRALDNLVCASAEFEERTQQIVKPHKNTYEAMKDYMGVVGAIKEYRKAKELYAYSFCDTALESFLVHLAKAQSILKSMRKSLPFTKRLGFLSELRKGGMSDGR